MKNNILEVEELNVSYEKIAVLWDISFSLEKGQCVGVIGPNGAGKTTLIKGILQLVKATSGSTLFFGKPLKKVRRRVSYVPQRDSIDWDFPITVFDAVLMGRYGHLGKLKWARKADKIATREMLEFLNLDKFADRQISQLSGGQKQRLFIARALLQDADLYFLDEPFAGIDLATEKLIIDLLKSLQKKGKTLFVIHHDLNTVENYFDKVMMLNTSMIAFGDVKKVFTTQNLNRTFGQKGVLFDEVTRLSHDKVSGLV